MVTHSLELSQGSSLLIVHMFIIQVKGLNHPVVIHSGGSEIVMQYHTSLGYALNIVNNNVICQHCKVKAESQDSLETEEHITKVKQEFGIPDYGELLAPKMMKIRTVLQNIPTQNCLHLQNKSPVWLKGNTVPKRRI